MKLSREEAVKEIQKRVDGAEDDIIQFLRDIVAIPSMNGELKEVGDRIAIEMNKLGFEEVRFDKMGNIMGRIGSGKKVIVYDSHIDTVGIGNREEWDWDPFVGKIEDGKLYARGAVDEKGSTPGMIYGLSFAHELGLLDGSTTCYFGNIEEWCDGIAPNTFVEVDPKVKPDFVVIGEPTKMNVYRGHKGRIEMKITAAGKSAHAASHYLGDNAIYKMAAVITQIRELDRRFRLGLGSHPVQGKPSVSVTNVEVRTASLNAVPDCFAIYLDRRITSNEPHDHVIEQIRGLIADYLKDEITVEELFYDEPSYTGFKFPVSKYYPAWFIEDDEPIVQAGQEAIKALWNEERKTDTWDFSTNGTYWAGKAGIPSIGFGPGDEKFAHALLEHVPLKEVVDATAFYALFPMLLAEKE